VALAAGRHAGLGIATVVVVVILGAILMASGHSPLCRPDDRGSCGRRRGRLLFLVPLLMILGTLGSFNHTYWVLAYLRLTQPTHSQSS
jgi:hypothetical protein